MNELLKKYESIDQSKLNEGAIKILNRVKTLTSEFSTDDAKNNKIAEDVLNEIMKKYPDSVKIVKRTPKAKPAPKKVAKAKKPATVSTAKKSGNNIMTVAKEIQKAGESWKEAMERAKQVLKDRREQVVQKQKTELEKLYALVKTKKELQGFTKSDIQRDAVRTAKPTGARFVTKQGTTSNGYGTFDNKIGRKYWETRDRHADRLAPNYPKDTPLLANGGSVSDAPFSVEVFKTKLRLDNELTSSSKGDFPTFVKAKEFAIDMIDNGNYYAYIISKNGYLWGVSSNGVESFANGGGIKETMIVNMPDGSDIKVETKSGTISKISKRVSVDESKNSVLFYKLPADLQQKINKRLNPDALANGGGIDGGMSNLTIQNVSFYKGGEVGKDIVIKDWYTKTYPTDDLGEELDENNTFEDIWTALHNGTDVYEVMGVGDSIIRERVFEETSKIYGVDYKYVYKKWYDSDDYANGGEVEGSKIWDLLSKEQKGNFITKYKPEIEKNLKLTRDIIFNSTKNDNWNVLDKNIKNVFNKHIENKKFYFENIGKKVTWEDYQGDKRKGEIDGIDFNGNYIVVGDNDYDNDVLSPDEVTIKDSSKKKYWLFDDGGSVSNERMYNFLQDDLEKLEKAINEDDTEQVEIFFSYWLGSSGHLKSLETKTNERMYNFLKDDLEKLEKAINDGDKEQIDIFFSYWGQHLESLKMANGGSLPFMTDPNFGNFQNTGAFAEGGSMSDLTEQEFLKKYFGANVFTENPSQYFEIKKMSSSDDNKVNAFVKELKADGFTVKKRAYSDFTSVMGVKKKESFSDGGNIIADTVSAIFNPNEKDGKIKTTFGDKTKTGFFEMMTSVNNTPEEITSAIFIPNEKMGRVYTEFGAKTKKGLYEMINNMRNTFELGGAFMMTDLAGHTGGSDGVGTPKPLSGVSGTYYTGLVGETGAMSSGELFMDGGAMAQNQQVINDASQSYVNYYLGEGASQGIYKDGGSIPNNYEGRTPEDVWDNWTQKQKLHFLSDHLVLSGKIEDFRASLYRYNELPKDLLSKIETKLTKHINEGQYASGGSLGEELMGGQSNATLKPSGYHLVSAKGREIIVSDDGGNSKERWVKNNGFSGYRLVYKGNDYEFTDSFENGGFTPDVSDGTQFMSGAYAYGGRTKSTPSMRKLYIEQIAFATNTRAVGVDDFAKEHNLTDAELSNLMTGIGRKMISQSDFVTALVGNKNNPKQKEVVAFAKSDKAYKMADGGDVLPPSKTYGENIYKAMQKFNISDSEARKKYGQYTISQWNELLSDKMADGGGLRSKEELKKIFSEKEAIVKNLTPKQIAEMWNKNSFGVKEGISKPITIEEAKRPSMKIYLENLLIENELTEDEQAKYFAKGGEMESTDITADLEKFNIDNLDYYEYEQYNHFLPRLGKAQSLQLLINTVDGDTSQLSPELAKLAEKQGSSYAKGGEIEIKTIKVGDFLQKKDNKAKAKVINIKGDGKYSTEIFIEDLYGNKVSRPLDFTRIDEWKIINEPSREINRIKKVLSEQYADGGFMNNVYAKHKGGEKADIQKMKKALIAKAKSKGIYENFGQNEVRDLQDKYGYTNSVREFDNWAMNFDLSQLADGGFMNNVYADRGSYLEDNDGFMKADNEFNYRYPTKDVYIETLDEPIDLTDNSIVKIKEVSVETINDDIDLNEDGRVKVRMGYEPENKNPEKFGEINPRAFEFMNLPMPTSKEHKND